MKIDQDSHITLAGWLLLNCILICIVLRFVPQMWIRMIVTAFLLYVSVVQVLFFRVPDRKSPGTDKIVSAVADGKIVIVEKVFESEYLKRECIQVSTYMDFFDVHANFWPVDGKVSYYKYHPGKYLLAFLPKSSELNEHSSTAIKTADGTEIFFKQIAGTFARRIVCYSEEGLETRAGEQLGIIKFGSRIDMFLPLDADIKVKIGDHVKACESVIANL